MKKKESLINKTVCAIIITALSKILAFVRSAVCAALFGATAKTDAFYMAINIFSIMTGPSTSLSTVIVPIRLKILQQESDDIANRFSSALLNLSLLISIILAFVLWIMAPWIVKIFAPEFSSDLFKTTVLFVRIFTPLIVITSIVSFFSGILNTHNKFVNSNLIGFALNIGWIIIPLLLAKQIGIYAMIFGYLFGSFLQIIVLLPGLKNLFTYFFDFSWNNNIIIHSLMMCVPIFIGTFSSSISQAIDKALASSLSEGNISALSYSSQLIGTINGILVIPIITTIFTTLSSLAQNNKQIAFKKLIMKAFSVIFLILSPVSIYCLLYSEKIIRFIYFRGAFDQTANYLTSTAFFYYAIGLVSTALAIVLARGFYALHDTKTPLLINIIGILINIALSILLVKPLGISGLTLATSISSIFTFIFMLYALRKKIGSLGFFEWISNAKKIFLALFISTFFVTLFKTFFARKIIFDLMSGALLYFAIYLLLLIILEEKEITTFTRKITDLIKNKCKKQ